jgi:hypothetical protein
MPIVRAPLCADTVEPANPLKNNVTTMATHEEEFLYFCRITFLR